MSASRPRVSVVVATYQRNALVIRLLEDLAAQSMPGDRFEVLLVDDGSPTPAAPVVASAFVDRPLPYALTVITQANAGPAAARHRAIARAVAPLVIIVDDDMRVGPDFLAAHLAAHADGTRRVALGPVRNAPGGRLPLFERFHLAMNDRLMTEVRAGRAALRGSHLYTGNVSFRRLDYEAVGGFDPAFRISEDAELGIRLEANGVAFVVAEGADAIHASDHTSSDAWLRRSHAYGVADASIAAKHPELPDADPWRFLAQVSPLSRPFLLAAATHPAAMRPVARAALAVARALDAAGLERAALTGATLVYGIAYFAGVRSGQGSRDDVLRSHARHLLRQRYEELGPIARVAKLRAEVRADHGAMCDSDAKYGSVPRRRGLARNAMERIGFQLMIAYRLMRFLRGSGLGLAARVTGRLIRHLYAADIHFEAELEPGVVIVHGTGIAIGHSARVGGGCILFQNVTLGVSVHSQTRAVGAPVLGGNVHVGPGATLLGPITVGAGSKVMAGVVLTRSVPPDSLVEAPGPVISPRVRARGRGAEASTAAALRSRAVRPLAEGIQ